MLLKKIVVDSWTKPFPLTQCAMAAKAENRLASGASQYCSAAARQLRAELNSPIQTVLVCSKR